MSGGKTGRTRNILPLFYLVRRLHSALNLPCAANNAAFKRFLNPEQRFYTSASRSGPLQRPCAGLY